jgi:hypothetical protein
MFHTRRPELFGELVQDQVSSSTGATKRERPQSSFFQRGIKVTSLLGQAQRLFFFGRAAKASPCVQPVNRSFEVFLQNSAQKTGPEL